MSHVRLSCPVRLAIATVINCACKCGDVIHAVSDVVKPLSCADIDAHLPDPENCIRSALRNSREHFVKHDFRRTGSGGLWAVQICQVLGRLLSEAQAESV